jgi:hypothetical protein
VLTVDIDIGGTLTDGIFVDGEKIICAKVDTTPHDLTICLFDCLTQGPRNWVTTMWTFSSKTSNSFAGPRRLPPMCSPN